MIPQSAVDIVHICAQKGVKRVILSPGSRCAPLTIAFARHQDISTFTVSDERSAAFIGHGMALKSNEPTALVCTSGSAAYNYAPTIAEAYFQQVPLIVFTADRPPEWINQHDGQTIYQPEIYGRHVKKSFTMPVDTSHDDALWHVHRIMNEAINLSKASPPGPVHVNVPFREPFYPEENEVIKASEQLRVTNELNGHPELAESDWWDIFKQWNNAKRILILGGQGDQDFGLDGILKEIGWSMKVPVLGDIISNLHAIDNSIKHQDLFLIGKTEDVKKDLAPDLLITFGKSIISKNIKLLLRKYKAKAHWHLQPYGEVADTYQSLTHIYRTSPQVFFTKIKNYFQDTGSSEAQNTFREQWQENEIKSTQVLKSFIEKSDFSDLSAYYHAMNSLPNNCDLHLANSMAVRYANFVGVNPAQTGIHVYANRGTSGIDGSNSTATGAAMISDRLTYLLTGDLAFFYDRNAFWHNYLPKNLRIIVFNNHAGGIFSLIDGPSRQPELAAYFETEQRLSCASTASEFGFEYTHCADFASLEEAFKTFHEISEQPKLIEISTDNAINTEVFKSLKAFMADNS